MSMKPMLFSAELTQAIRDERKTVTRRVVRPHAPNVGVGDVLYVPEPWRCAGLCDDGRYKVTFRDGEAITFPFQDRGRAARWYKYIRRPQWQSPYHMPREAARLFLRVTDVLAMPLQASFYLFQPIFELQAEGIDIGPDCRACIEANVYPRCIDHGTDQRDECEILDFPLYEFADLWDSTIPPVDLARYGWAADPAVWVIRFERISREAAMG